MQVCGKRSNVKTLLEFIKYSTCLLPLRIKQSSYNCLLSCRLFGYCYT
jgi:hypothetical protein